MELAAERAREEWAKLTARAREASKEREEVFVEREEESVDNVEDEVVVEQDEGENDELVEKEEIEEGSGEVEDRFYSQLEVSDMEAGKRGLLNWVMQMEYAGKTFFDGYVSIFLPVFFIVRVVVVIVVVVVVDEIGWMYFARNGADDSWDFFTEPDPSNGCKFPSPLFE